MISESDRQTTPSAKSILMHRTVDALQLTAS